MLADMVHHVRSELPPAQLTKVVKVYSSMLHNPALTGGIQTMSAKVLVTLTDSVMAKHSRSDAADILYDLLQSDVDRLLALHTTHSELTLYRKVMEDPEASNITYVSLEKSKPIFGAAFAFEPMEDVLKGAAS